MTQKEIETFYPSESGSRCPHCNQYVKIYNRKITSSMAYALILIKKFFDENNDEWLHVSNYLSNLNIPTAVKGGDFAKLRYWGLIEDQKGEREDGSWRIGFYKITKFGRMFVNGDYAVQKYVKIYNQEFYGFDGEVVSIKDCLGKKFNYNELMGKELEK